MASDNLKIFKQMKKIIQILYIPQECGNAEVHIVDLSSGQVIRKYDLGYGGYSTNGLSFTSKWTPVGEPFTVSEPGLLDVMVGTIIYYHGTPHYVRKVEKREDDLDIVHLIEAKEKIVANYRQARDGFRKLLKKQGVDMTNWGQPKRHNTPIQEFVREALHEEDEEVMNLLIFR